jgi:hypothetical protein
MKGLRRGTKDHGEDDAKSIVKTGNGFGEQRGVLIERSRYPGMRQLQKRSSAGTEEERGFAIDAPGDGVGSEDTADGIFDALFSGCDVELEILGGDGGIGRGGRRHQLLR